MTKQVKIEGGVYKIRGNDTDVSDIVFTQVDTFRFGTAGGYVTVDGRATAGFPDRNIKIKCASADCITEVDGKTAKAAKKEETDDEVIERLRNRFDMLNDLTKATKKGDVRAMIVSGPPGVGKSFGVETTLTKYDTAAAMSGQPPKYEVIKGAMSALGLYCKLYNMSSKDNVVVFDDCDSILLDDLSLNILKAALDSKKVRRISWNTDSHKLREEGIPDTFEFKGSAIFITNIKFDNVKSKKLRDHLLAIESRCHYMDLTIDTVREKMLRIKQIVRDGMLDEYSFTAEQRDAIVDFVELNADRLRELSLRTVIKVADLAKAFPGRWEDYAENTVMRRA